MADERDGVEVIWAYRPDDRSKQDTSEWLPADLAKIKVAEGLARWPRDGEGSSAVNGDEQDDAELAEDVNEVRAYGTAAPVRKLKKTSSDVAPTAASVEAEPA